MSKPKILIFAPREEPPETINALEGIGCELVFGARDWQLPRAAHEDAVVAAAGKFRLLRWHPPIGRFSRPDHRACRFRADRHACGAAPGALAGAHHRL